MSTHGTLVHGRPVRQAPAAPPRLRLRALAAEQAAVAAGQVAAGVGNLAFSLVVARLLAPGAFAQLAAFLALYLVLHVPAGSLSAGSALTPGLATAARRRALRAGLGAAAALAALSVPLGAALDVDAMLLLALAAAAPAAPLLALERGRLYGTAQRARAAASLAIEPAVRLAAGLALGATLGAPGAAAGVVLAGWAALAVAAGGRGRAAGAVRTGEPTGVDAAPAADAAPGVAARASGAAAGANAGASPPAAGAADADGAAAVRASTRAAAGATIVAFLLLAALQNEDVLLANALLAPGEAGAFAVLSTLGGIAAFATTTVPLMLLPRAAAGQRGALGAALGVAALLGAGAVAVVAVAPDLLVTAAFGDRYAPVADLAPRYVAAMALIGVARVLIADACARCRPRAALVVLGGGVVLHLALLAAIGHSAAGVADATLLSAAVLTGAAGVLAAATQGGAVVLPFPRRAAVHAAPPRRLAARPLPWPGLALLALVAFALVIRLLATRGLWLDEAISVHQAQMSLPDLLENLRTTDVHPPLHHLVLWATVRLAGTSELAVRVPSLIASTALVPVLYAAARDVWDRRAGMAAAALAAVAPLPIWYADEARMYALMMLFAALAAWTQLRAIRDGRPRDFALWALSAAALVYTQYFAALFVAAQQLAFLWAVVRRPAPGRPSRRALAVGWAGALALAALLIAPLSGFALDQFRTNQAAGKGFNALPSQAGAGATDGLARPTIYGALTNWLWAAVGYHSDATMLRLAALWPLAMLACFGLLGRGRDRAVGVLAVAAVLPMAGLFALGQLKPFIFEIRYFCGAVPLVLLLGGRALTAWTPRALPAAGATLAVAALLGLGTTDQQLNQSNPRTYDFRGALARVEERARPGDVLVYSPPYLNHIVAYYGDSKLRVRPLGRGVPPRRAAGRVFLLASFLDKPQYRAATTQALQALRDRRRQVATFRRPQIRVWEFR